MYNVIPCSRCGGSGIDPQPYPECCGNPRYGECCGDPVPAQQQCQNCGGHGCEQYEDIECEQINYDEMFTEAYPNSYIAVDVAKLEVVLAATDKDTFIKGIVALPPDIVVYLGDTFFKYGKV